MVAVRFPQPLARLSVRHEKHDPTVWWVRVRLDEPAELLGPKGKHVRGWRVYARRVVFPVPLLDQSVEPGKGFDCKIKVSVLILEIRCTIWANSLLVMYVTSF